MHVFLVALSVLGVTRVVSAGPVTVPSPGDVIARLVVEASFTRHRTLQPLSVAPDLIVGVRARLAVALHHSRMFDGRLGAGNGICLMGTRETLGSAPADCGAGYSGVGASVLYELAPWVTARTGATLLDVSPLKAALTLGAILRGERARWWFVLAPTVFSGVTRRDDGNRDRVGAPLYVGANVGWGEVHLRTGFDATIQTAADTFSIPLGAGGSFSPGGGWRIGGDVTLDRALGMLNGTSWRSASLYIELDHGGGS